MDKNATALMGNNEAVEFLQAKAASETNLGKLNKCRFRKKI